jgi:phosphoribosyl-AMP cyclohydrolase / phosphoribosyl-ATP pyrophosphohydrolase
MSVKLDKGTAEKLIQSMDFKKENGLIPVVSQSTENKSILMLAFMNKEAMIKTLTTGYAHYWSRSRGKLWKKGEESGHVQHVKGIYVDCDRDSLLLEVEQEGNCCHLDTPSCFSDRIAGEHAETLEGSKILDNLFEVIKSRIKDPTPKSYVAGLAAAGEDAVLRKIGEEATELILAAKSEGPKRTLSEATDLLFHTMILLAEKGLELDEVYRELASRRKPPRETVSK